MKFYNNNLDFTGSKYNNPYALIQQAGKRKKNKTYTRRKKYRTRTRSRRNKRYSKRT